MMNTSDVSAVSSDVPVVAPPQPSLAPSRWQSYRIPLLSIALIVAISFIYGRILLNFDPLIRLEGREVEWTLETDMVAWHAIRVDGKLPLWNPYWNTGRPLLADPFFHGFDPKMFIPQALFGPLNGAKIGLILSFAVMGVGGWWLGRVMRLGDFAALWLGLMLALNGHMIGYFSGVSSIGLGLSYSYVVWVIAATLALRQTPSPRNTVLFGLSVALLFLGSNFYFFAYTAIAMGLVFLGETVALFFNRQRVAEHRRFTIHLVIGGLLALALAAIVVLPQLEIAGYLSKPPVNDDFELGQPLEALFNNFIISDVDYYLSSLFNLYGHMIGHYSYIGLLPFFLILGVPLAWQTGNRRIVLWLVVIFFVGITYAAGNHTPLWTFYRNLPGAENLRFPERGIGMAVIALLALAAIGLNHWWQSNGQQTYKVTLGVEREGNGSSAAVPINFIRVALLALAGTAVWGVYQGNMPHMTMAPSGERFANVIVAAQNAIGEREFHLSVPPDFSLLATSSANVGQINPPQTWVLERAGDVMDWGQVMNRGAEYALVVDGSLPAETMGRHEFVADLPDYDLYYLPDAMPYAFTTAWESTPFQTLNEASATVQGLEATRPSLRRIHVSATTDANQRLVVAESYYPGWRAFIDGVEVPLEPFNGFLSLRTTEGTHEYGFYFDPLLPKLGMLITLLALPYTLWVALANRWLPQRRTPKSVQGESNPILQEK